MENKNNLERFAMATITKDEIMILAKLSRLTIYEHELPELQKHVEDVLTYARRVTEVARDVTDVVPGPSNVFRDDQVVPVDVEPIMAQAPEREGNYFVVPRILEHNE